MEYCDECQEQTNDHYKIGDDIYCLSCIYKYELVKCPGRNCINVISLNNYGYDNNEKNTCNICHIIVCNSCIVRSKNLILCDDCFDK